MFEEREDRFLYQAHAVGFSGQIRRPFAEIIEAQAMSALPSLGGFAHAWARDFRFKGIIRFDAAHTVVTGSEGASGFDTLISASIENLNILDQVTANRVVAHMVSHHDRAQKQPVITPLGSHFEGLRIAGTAVEVDLNVPPACEEQTYDALCQALGKQPNGDPHNTPLITELPDVPGVKKIGNRYIIPRFGSVHLADFICSPYARRLIMLRFKLGCPVEAEATACDIDGNGSPFPPD